VGFTGRGDCAGLLVCGCGDSEAVRSGRGLVGVGEDGRVFGVIP
jgi:hypothetical protein